jgi:hypothetical protein
LICYTDSLGTESSNYKLANKRGIEVEKSLKFLKIKTDVIDIIPKGENKPLYSNTSDIERRKNRRVDVVMFPILDGEITFTGSQGTTLTIDKGFFYPCSICESDPHLVEILNNEQAAERGISMLTSDGMEMVTGGMVHLEFDCPERRTDTCFTATVKFPIVNERSEIDSLMIMWEPIITDSGMRWVEVPDKICKKNSNSMTTIIDCFPGASGNPNSNCDIAKFPNSLVFPQMDKNLSDTRYILDTNSVITINKYIDSNYIVRDYGVVDENVVAYFKGTPRGYFTKKISKTAIYTVPLSAYKLYKLPKLNRSPISLKKPNYDSLILRIQDKGFDEFGIEYSLNSHLNSLNSSDSIINNKTYKVISLSNYKVKLEFEDTVNIIKTPKRFIKDVVQVITPIDSIIYASRTNSKGNKFLFYNSKHPWSIGVSTKPHEKLILLGDKEKVEVCKIKYLRKDNTYMWKIRKRKLKKLIKNELF